MRFETIGEVTTVTFDMDGLKALARICQSAVDCGAEGLVADVFLAAFTAATLIARTHGDMNAAMQERMVRIHARITAGEREDGAA